MTFKTLIQPLQKALDKQGYSIPTPIQSQSIPGLLEGRDLIGVAQTGTGKTAAFVLPILQMMKHKHKIQTLVLAPTRELAAQIGESFSVYGKFLNFKHTVIFGGVKQGNQVKAIKKGVDILVATPGRLLDLMQQGIISLKDIEFFVLDEADRMLDMGFLPDIKRVIEKLPDKRQSLFFSATMSPEISKLARSFLKDPLHVEVAPQATTVDKIDQKVFFVDSGSKNNLLVKLLEHEHLTSVLVFTRTKHRANKLANFLNKNKIYADAIHGNKSQKARTRALKDFKSGKVKVLVATDIAARGIDVNDISHVINYEIPNEAESYVHRIGRTARAGKEGTAYSFCAAQERKYLHDIEKLIKQHIDVMDHEFHSEEAKNAKGSAARPPKKGNFRGNRGNRGRSNNRGKNRRDNNKRRSNNKGKRSNSDFSRRNKTDSKGNSKDRSKSNSDSKHKNHKPKDKFRNKRKAKHKRKRR